MRFMGRAECWKKGLLPRALSDTRRGEIRPTLSTLPTQADLRSEHSTVTVLQLSCAWVFCLWTRSTNNLLFCARRNTGAGVCDYKVLMPRHGPDMLTLLHHFLLDKAARKSLDWPAHGGHIAPVSRHGSRSGAHFKPMERLSVT